MTLGGWLILTVAIAMICGIGYSLDLHEDASDERDLWADVLPHDVPHE
jgi:hypothetical protein